MMTVWGWPILIGVLSVFGLASGLFSDGVGDKISWFCLLIPVAIVGRTLIYSYRLRPENAVNLRE